MFALVQACRTAVVPLVAVACFLAGLVAVGLEQAAATTPAGTVPADLASRYARNARLSGSADRQFLTYDTAGRGLVTEVFGDLDGVRAVVVAVGGVGTDLRTFDRSTLRRSAVAVVDSVPDAAVVAWADYVSPARLGPSAAGPVLADEGGARLGIFLDSLQRNTSATRVVLVCHSYGSAVCAAALADSAHGVDAVVDLASAGVGDGALPAGVHRFAAIGDADPIRFLPHVRFAGVGLGADPLSLAGVTPLPVPTDCDHDGYLVPGSPTLTAVVALLA
ncbi:alpha/beta hydrolase [Kineococcus sp. SYSU DK003]|uniref:alpha/beta hydrolase n=1 Tax=Kineococcus sp. SYSU DK003 TaxID=3383124 RepID=UPI003D7C7751